MARLSPLRRATLRAGPVSREIRRGSTGRLGTALRSAHRQGRPSRRPRRVDGQRRAHGGVRRHERGGPGEGRRPDAQRDRGTPARARHGPGRVGRCVAGVRGRDGRVSRDRRQDGPSGGGRSHVLIPGPDAGRGRSMCRPRAVPRCGRAEGRPDRLSCHAVSRPAAHCRSPVQGSPHDPGGQRACSEGPCSSTSTTTAIS